MTTARHGPTSQPNQRVTMPVCIPAAKKGTNPEMATEKGGTVKLKSECIAAIIAICERGIFAYISSGTTDSTTNPATQQMKKKMYTSFGPAASTHRRHSVCTASGRFAATFSMEAITCPVAADTIGSKKSELSFPIAANTILTA